MSDGIRAVRVISSNEKFFDEIKKTVLVPNISLFQLNSEVELTKSDEEVVQYIQQFYKKKNWFRECLVTFLSAFGLQKGHLGTPGYVVIFDGTVFGREISPSVLAQLNDSLGEKYFPFILVISINPERIPEFLDHGARIVLDREIVGNPQREKELIATVRSIIRSDLQHAKQPLLKPWIGGIFLGFIFLLLRAAEPVITENWDTSWSIQIDESVNPPRDANHDFYVLKVNNTGLFAKGHLQIQAHLASANHDLPDIFPSRVPAGEGRELKFGVRKGSSKDSRITLIGPWGTKRSETLSGVMGGDSKFVSTP